MKPLTVQAFAGRAHGFSRRRQRLVERRRAARQALRRAADVTAVLVLGRALPATRWAGLLVQ
jgi:hypothetical protein